MLYHQHIVEREKMRKPSQKPERRRVDNTVRPAASPEEIGRRIVHYRDKLGMSVMDFAKAIGVGKPAADKIFNGMSCKKYFDLINIAVALKVTPNDLLGFEGGEKFNPNAVRGAIEASYVSHGYSSKYAEEIAQIVLKAVSDAPIASAHLDQETSARVQSELGVRAFLAEK